MVDSGRTAKAFVFRHLAEDANSRITKARRMHSASDLLSEKIGCESLLDRQTVTDSIDNLSRFEDIIETID